MKRTLGMLLALCFLMSVTVATVGAERESYRPGGNYTDHPPVAPPHPPVAPPSYHPSYHPPVAPPSYYHPAPFVPVFKPGHGPIAKLVKISAHFETKKVKKFVGFKHGKKVYKTVTIKIFVPAKWIKVPVYNNHNNNHR